MDQENFNPNQIIDGNNESESTSVRVQKAKQFLEENPHECTITAARIYNLHPTTLYSVLAINRPSKPYSGHNNISKELDLQKQEVPSELLISIPDIDPEQILLAEQGQLQSQLKNERAEQEEEQSQELTLIIDEVGD